MSIPAVIPHPIFDVPGPTADTSTHHVALDGRGFLIDTASNEYRWSTIPLLRQQADTAERPSEQSINPDDLWRRVVDSWHKGAGQKFYDQADSDPERFWESKGADPWERGELGVLPAVDQILATALSNVYLAVAGSRLWATNGQAVAYTTDLQVFFDITGTPAANPIGITSDGFTVYIAYAADGIYTTTGGAASSWATGNLEGAKWVQGRLFAWNNANLYNVTGSGALPSALIGQSNSDFTWVDVAAAGGFYYAAGYSGDKSLIYYTNVKSDGTGLEAPLEAGQLPDGEIVRSIYGYLGFVLIGTDKGVRFATSDGGPLNIGSLITTSDAVRCFEGQDRFVWFGWQNYDDDSTGLGRLDLSVFNTAQPAYASDLMAPAQGAVRSVVTFDGRRVFSVGTSGVWAESAETVTEATLTTGHIGFGLTDNKILRLVKVRHARLGDGEIGVTVQQSGNDWLPLAGETGPAGWVTKFPAGVIGTQHQIEVTFSDATIQRIQLRAYPQVIRTEEILVPILIGRNQQRAGVHHGRDPSDDIAFLLALEDSGESFLFEDGLRSAEVVLEDHQWSPTHTEDDGWAGTFLARLKKFPTE